MRNAFIAKLTELADDPRVFTILADNGIIVFDDYIKKHPGQLINVGIAECNGVGVASGMASCGFMPFFYTITPFLTARAYEFIRNDICLHKRNVKLVGIGAGFAYSALGPTHHGTEDITLMRSIPGLKIFSPADPEETKRAAVAAYEDPGPVYLRIGTGRNPAVYEGDADFIPGKAVVLKDGSDVTLFSTGTILRDILDAAFELEESGISARVINVHTIRPIDKDIIFKAAKETKALFSIEEHSVVGGLGSAIADVIVQSDMAGVKFRMLGLNDVFAEGYGSVQELRAKYGFDKHSIIKAVKEV